MRIKFLRKWRRLRNRGRKWKVYLGRRWRRVSRKGRRWYLRYKKHLRRLRRNPRTFQIRLGKRYRGLKRRGRRYFVKIGRKFRRVGKRFTWFIKYKGRRLLTRRKGRRARIRWRGKWRRGRRLRYRRPTRPGKDKIDINFTGIHRLLVCWLMLVMQGECSGMAKHRHVPFTWSSIEGVMFARFLFKYLLSLFFVSLSKKRILPGVLGSPLSVRLLAMSHRLSLLALTHFSAFSKFCRSQIWAETLIKVHRF